MKAWTSFKNTIADLVPIVLAILLVFNLSSILWPHVQPSKSKMVGAPTTPPPTIALQEMLQTIKKSTQ